MAEDIGNKWLVGSNGDSIVILNPPSRLTKEEALVLAAWLVALADPAGEDFTEIMEAVAST